LRATDGQPKRNNYVNPASTEDRITETKKKVFIKISISTYLTIPQKSF